MKDPNAPKDSEWEQERSLWEAQQAGDAAFDDSLSLNEFKLLLDAQEPEKTDNPA